MSILAVTEHKVVLIYRERQNETTSNKDVSRKLLCLPIFCYSISKVLAGVRTRSGQNKINLINILVLNK